mmetsp:Transcript_16631/g.50160  ORF Transcript_16631/g.50160 Transcript_16631/m.50160 type:complete len:256 (-) Transcript_16631:408-1175(-)
MVGLLGHCVLFQRVRLNFLGPPRRRNPQQWHQERPRARVHSCLWLLLLLVPRRRGQPGVARRRRELPGGGPRAGGGAGPRLRFGRRGCKLRGGPPRRSRRARPAVHPLGPQLHRLLRDDLKVAAVQAWSARLAVGPGRNLHVLEHVVRQGEKLEHGQHEDLKVRQEVRVVLHVRRRDQQLPAGQELEKCLRVAEGDQLIALAVDDHGGARNLRRAPLVAEPFLDQTGKEAHAIAEELLYRQEGRHKDYTCKAKEA